MIQVESRRIISKNAMLQKILKAVNNTTDSDSLIQTLFVFCGYHRIITNLSLLSLQQQRVNLFGRTMMELRKLEV